jgi:hypothetical protein
MASKGAQDPLSATGAGLKPGEYPLGSAQSRAAARALLERRFAGRNRLDIVSSIPRPGGDGAIHIGAWSEAADGTLLRFSNIPAGMTLEEAERIVAARRPNGGHLPHCNFHGGP